MFSLSCNKLFTYCNLRLLRKEYTICNKYLRISSRKTVSQGFSVKPSLRTSNEISSSSYFNKRYFSSKLVNDVIKTTDDKNTVEKLETEELSSDGSSNDEIEDFYRVDEEAITGGDPGLLKTLKLCMLEVETFRQEGFDVPAHLNVDQWKELIQCKSRSSKLKYLRFLFISECRKKNDKIRKEKKRAEREEKMKDLIESSNPDHIRYGLGGNTIFIRIHESTMNVLANNRLILAMKFGQNLVIDCSYDSYMSKKEMYYCAKQFLLLFAYNRNHDDPFNIHFTGINPKSETMKRFQSHIPTMYDPDFPINVTEKSYLEVFPKERLVYLTPHCRNELKTFSHDDIYIIGGIVDKINCEPLSLAKAKSEGIRMAKFPLDRYLSWSIGTKSLTLDQCVNILLEMKKSGDWNKALVHVPKRKLATENNEYALNKEDDEAKDKSMRFGQSYVTSHEWGIRKGKVRTAGKRPTVYKRDIRLVVDSYKKRNKDGR